jgi:hypothetical protein
MGDINISDQKVHILSGGRKFTLEGKLFYYNQKLTAIKNGWNIDITIDDSTYIYYITKSEYHELKNGCQSRVVNREDIISRLESHIMMITRKKKIDKIKNRI